MSKERKKYSTYLTVEAIQAVKNLAHAKGISANYIIEAAIKKCIPERFFKNPYKKG